MDGTATWRGNQDLNVTTFTGRAWGTGVIETDKGTWHVVYKGAFENGVGGSEGKGHGRDGLQSLKMHYAAGFGGVPPEDPCQGTATDSPIPMPIIMTFAGTILDPKGD
jgi:hypothetical protein